MRTLLESALAPGGQLVLSCEAVIESGPDLALRPSGCCAYKHSHVHALGQAAGFDKVEIEGTMLRQKNNAPVHSFVAWAHKPAWCELNRWVHGPRTVGPTICPICSKKTWHFCSSGSFLHWCLGPVLRASAVSDNRHQLSSRDERGRCADRNSIWSARMRRLRKMKSSHRLGT